MSEERIRKNIIRIELSSDYYSAFLTIIKDDDAPSVKESEVQSALAERQVVFGVDNAAIRQAISEGEVVNRLIASGIPHKNGEDAELKYNFDTNIDAKPEVLEDGTVNFKNIGFIKSCSAGAVLVEKKLATEGVSGTTVTGRNISGRSGKDKVLAAGKNTHLSEDGTKLISDIDGRINFDGKKVSVLSVMEINGDVGIGTGNIKFVGSVVVTGNICNGYEIETTGDLTIHGVIEGAVVRVGGNLNLARGIKGHGEAKVSVQGNLITNFINSADVWVGGNIEANNIMTANVRCDGNIILSGKKGQLIGSEVLCKGNLEAMVIGSDLEVITDVKMGLDTDVVKEIQSISAELKENLVNHERLSKDLQTLLNKLKLNPDNEKLKQTIFVNKKEYDALEEKSKEQRTRLRLLQELANTVSTSYVKAGHMYPGVRVKIGNSIYHVKFQMQNTILKKDKGEIVAIGY